MRLTVTNLKQQRDLVCIHQMPCSNDHWITDWHYQLIVDL